MANHDHGTHTDPMGMAKRYGPYKLPTQSDLANGAKCKAPFSGLRKDRSEAIRTCVSKHLEVSEELDMLDDSSAGHRAPRLLLRTPKNQNSIDILLIVLYRLIKLQIVLI